MFTGRQLTLESSCVALDMTSGLDVSGGWRARPGEGGKERQGNGWKEGGRKMGVGSEGWRGMKIEVGRGGRRGLMDTGEHRQIQDISQQLDPPSSSSSSSDRPSSSRTTVMRQQGMHSVTCPTAAIH